MRRHADYSLYLVTDRPLCLGRDLLEVVSEAIHGGVTVVQLREKDADTREFVELARALKKVLKEHDIPLFINDRLDIVLACGADGVHVGQSDMHVQDVRKIMGNDLLVGLSVETESQAEEARALDIDYIGVGPVYPTSTKLDACLPLGLDGLCRIRDTYDGTLVAIGSINAATATEVAQAGADGIAVVSAICSAPSPRESSAELLRLFQQERSD